MQLYRLFLSAPLSANAMIELEQNHAHYLRNVLRLNVSDAILVFNGSDGEWECRISQLNKKLVEITVVSQTRAQTAMGTIDVYCAPLKSRLEYSIQKQVEMGARSITPIKTQHTQVSNLNMDKIQSYIYEAAEQCGILSIPKLHPLQNLRDLIENIPNTTKLIFCDEAAPVSNPFTAVQAISEFENLGLLIGPEGGFSTQERSLLRAHSNIVPIALGPRILRADTALVAAMAIIECAMDGSNSQNK